MRQLLPLVLAFLLILPSHASSDRAAAPVMTLEKLIQTVERSLVKIEYPDSGSVCTGFVVDAPKGLALTAQHCVTGENTEMMVDGEVSKVVKTSGSLALVEVKPMNRPPLDIRKAKARVGEMVVSFGFGYGWKQVMPRFVSSLNNGDVFLDGTISPGMSGGPTVDYAGRVVGLNQATDPRFSLAQTCGAEEILEFLNRK